MPTGYIEWCGVKLTRREYMAIQKERLQLELDHFDLAACERARNKWSKKMDALVEEAAKHSKSDTHLRKKIRKLIKDKKI